MQTTLADDPYQFLWLLNEKILIFRQCRAVWFTWQHLNTEVPLLVTLIISDGQLLFKLNLHLEDTCIIVHYITIT